jgi:hypothetical protein
LHRAPWRLVISNPLLQTAAVGEVISRATFDAEQGVKDPDVTVLDVGHPLVRRLIEVVKESAFRETPGFEGHYGRTSYIVTADVPEVTALFHLLVRYVVKMEPTSIIEELLPVAVPVYGGAPLGEADTRRLLAARPTPQTRTEGEVRETLADALRIAELDKLFAAAVESRREALVAERRQMRQKLEKERIEGAKWLQGIDDLSPGSHDLLTVKIYYPE